MKSLNIIFIVGLISIPILVTGQDQIDKVSNNGLTVSVQNNQFEIMVPFFLSSKFVMAPAFQFTYASNVGCDITFGLLVKRFFTDKSNFRPYFGLRGGLVYFNPRSSGIANQLDFVIGGAIGVEYFFNPNFSIGIEPQLNFSFSDDESDRFGNPGGTGINTATALTVNIYF